MASNDQEVEVKFPVRDLPGIAARLEALGARITAPRVLEINLRFDTPDGALSKERRVLRLRQDAGAVMTFKGPSQPGESVSVRQEIEFTVSDFAAARRLLEALGYAVVVTYEKFRTTFALHNLLVVLDELPFGSFIEIEGGDAEGIHAAADALGLDWGARSTASYLSLFAQLSAARRLTAKNLTFDELAGVQAHPKDMGLRYAD